MLVVRFLDLIESKVLILEKKEFSTNAVTDSSKKIKRRIF